MNYFAKISWGGLLAAILCAVCPFALAVVIAVFVVESSHGDVASTTDEP